MSSRPSKLAVNGTLVWSILLQDATGAAVNAGSSPTVTIYRKTSSGAYVATGEATTITNPVTGEYACTLDPSGEAAFDTIKVVEEVTIAGTTYPPNVWYCDVEGQVGDVESSLIDFFETQTRLLGGVSYQDALQLSTASLMGTSIRSGATDTFRHLDGSDAFTVTFDTDNYRTAVVVH